jgi:acyl carrier protein
MTTNNDQMRRQLVEVISRVFRVAPEVVERGVSPDRIEGWDSEKHVELVVALEERFNLMFEAEEVPELTSLEQMEAILSRHA